MTEQDQPTPSPGPRLGKLIEERRHLLGLTKSEAARRANINRGTWHEVETGTRTNMLPDTLNLIELALQWEPGTLYKLTKSDEDHDIVLTQRDGTAVIVEAKRANNTEVSASTSRRRQLMAFAATLDDDDLFRVLDFIARGLHGTEAPVTREEIERMRIEIERAMNDKMHRLAEGLHAPFQV